MCGRPIWLRRENRNRSAEAPPRQRCEPPKPAVGKCLTKSVPACCICCTLVCRGGLRVGGDTDVTEKSGSGNSTHRINLNWTFLRLPVYRFFFFFFLLFAHVCSNGFLFTQSLLYVLTSHLTAHSLFYALIYSLLHLMYCSLTACT